MKKLKFEKGIDKIHIPVCPEFLGESGKQILKAYNNKKYPKCSSIEFRRKMRFEKGKEYDLTEIILEK